MVSERDTSKTTLLKKKIWRCKPCHKKYEKYSHFVRHRRKRHAEQVAKTKHVSQLRNYGQTGEEFEATLKQQNGVCASCGQPPKNISLSQDHTHFIAKLKIIITKEDDFWIARNKEFGYSYRSHNRKKAKKMVLLKLKRKSRRGVICWLCNTGLKKFRDNCRLLFCAARYLRYWSLEQGWDYVKKERIKDKEIWKSFRHGLYEVSNWGRVRSIRNNIILKPSFDKDYYLHINSSYNGRTKTHKIHQLVAEAFIGSCPKEMEVHHKDENVMNNHWRNLEYITNTRHARHHTSNLSAIDVKEIKRLYATGKYHGHSNTLAKKFGISPTTVYFIVSGRRWNEIPTV